MKADKQGKTQTFAPAHIVRGEWPHGGLDRVDKDRRAKVVVAMRLRKCQHDITQASQRQTHNSGFWKSGCGSVRHCGFYWTAAARGVICLLATEWKDAVALPD
jgi:hypothetical protein